MNHREMHPDGLPCLVCEVRTKSEGQLCDACVDKGHRRVNDTVEVNLTPFLATPGQQWTWLKPVDDASALPASPVAPAPARTTERD